MPLPFFSPCPPHEIKRVRTDLKNTRKGIYFLPNVKKSLALFSLFGWKLKPACHNSRNCNIFIKFLPSERIAIKFYGDSCKLFFGSLRENFESVSWKSDNPAIVELHKTVRPSLQTRMAAGSVSRRVSASMVGIEGFQKYIPILVNDTFNLTQIMRLYRTIKSRIPRKRRPARNL